MNKSITIAIKGYDVIIDAEDAGRVLAINWCPDDRKDGRVYFMGVVDGEKTRLHRFVAGSKRGERTDHENRNTLDNRKGNLRRCTTSQNSGNMPPHRRNTSGFKGVILARDRFRRKPWRAFIAKQPLGYYATAHDAANAYDRAAIERWGEFALTNAKLGLL